MDGYFPDNPRTYDVIYFISRSCLLFGSLIPETQVNVLTGYSTQLIRFVSRFVISLNCVSDVFVV